MLHTRIKTVADLMSVALQAEREAIKRYYQLASEMRAANNQSSADLFSRMVIEEQEHLRLLQEWMQWESIEENTAIGPISWRDPQVATTYDDEAINPYRSTVYKALAFAVHNEEIAFRFYSYVAAESGNEKLRQYAESLAREELGHAALLRAERRKAFRAEHKPGATEPRLDPASVDNEADLLASAIHLDRQQVDVLADIEKDYPLLASLLQTIRQQIEANLKSLRQLALERKITPGEALSLVLDHSEHYDNQSQTSQSAAAKLERLGSLFDYSFAFFDRIASGNADESIMLAAQALTTTALDRIGVLQRISGGDTKISEA